MNRTYSKNRLPNHYKSKKNVRTLKKDIEDIQKRQLQINKDGSNKKRVKVYLQSKRFV